MHFSHVCSGTSASGARGGKPGGVVDEDVDTAEIVLHAGDSLPRGLRIRNVALPADRGSALGDDHASGFGRRLRVDVARLNLRPLAGKGERDGLPDTAACAGDQRALPARRAVPAMTNLPAFQSARSEGSMAQIPCLHRAESLRGGCYAEDFRDRASPRCAGIRFVAGEHGHVTCVVYGKSSAYRSLPSLLPGVPVSHPAGIGTRDAFRARAPRGMQPRELCAGGTVVRCDANHDETGDAHVRRENTP